LTFAPNTHAIIPSLQSQEWSFDSSSFENIPEEWIMELLEAEGVLR
jgi:hypothetical protein